MVLAEKAEDDLPVTEASGNVKHEQMDGFYDEYAVSTQELKDWVKLAVDKNDG